jgi:hypothetical protein
LNSCRYSSSHGRPFLPRSRRIPSTVSASCISQSSRSCASDHLCPFALRTAFPSSLAGRDPCDYYGHCVAIGLASLRRSHVRLCHTYLARLRRSTHLLECPRWASLRSRGLRQAHLRPAAGAAPVTGVFPAGVRIAPSGDWTSGNPAFAISRGPPGTPSHTPGPGSRFPGMLFSPVTLSRPGKPSDPEIFPPISPRCTGDTAERLVAQRCIRARGSGRSRRGW